MNTRIISSETSFIYQENIILRKRIADLEKLLAEKNTTCYETDHAEVTGLAASNAA